jgi:hypothetical protein
MLLRVVQLLHKKCLNPVVVAFLIDPIGDGHRFLGHLESLAEGPGEALQLGAGQGAQAAEVPGRCVEEIEISVGGIMKVDGFAVGGNT